MIKQPPNSKLCGQCCLATILGITLDEAIKLIGHSHGTYAIELVRHFDHGAIVIGKMPNEYALCKIRPLDKKIKKSHWIVYYPDQTVYDPGLGFRVAITELLNITESRLISYVPIL